MKASKSDAYQKELIWALAHGTELSQDEIADHPAIDKSQPTVSRILNNYDPALDGTEIVGSGYGRAEDTQTDAPPVTTYREALAEAMLHAPMLAPMVGMAKHNNAENDG